MWWVRALFVNPSNIDLVSNSSEAFDAVCLTPGDPMDEVILCEQGQWSRDATRAVKLEEAQLQLMFQKRAASPGSCRWWDCDCSALLFTHHMISGGGCGAIEG